MTECNQSSFGFEAFGTREIVSKFDGGTISSDGGSLLLRQTDKRLNLLPRLAKCFLEGRNQDLVEHSVQQMVWQRIYGLALGYEDLNDLLDRSAAGQWRSGVLGNRSPRDGTLGRRPAALRSGDREREKG